MDFIETRGNDGKHPVQVKFSDAILSPIASYGGLYVPKTLPDFGIDFLTQHIESNYQTLAKAILQAFAIDIPEAVIDEALACYQTFDDPLNPVPLVKVRERLYISELYHGPTRAFKDMALQPFGLILSALAKQQKQAYLILTATSGDTGPAALETFKNRENIRVACLYPNKGTSDVQRLQMVTESAENLKVIGIQGVFDDAQDALKHLLGSTTFKQKLAQKQIKLSAANSVNFGRIIFQIIYQVYSYLALVRQKAINMGDKIYLNIPSGNFGNALGAHYAMKSGLPVEKILIASNRNNVLTTFIRQGLYDLRNAHVVATNSPAMDILKSSNVERILFDLYGAKRTKSLLEDLDSQHYYQLTRSELTDLQAVFSADYCLDDEVSDYIQNVFYHDHYLLDPHTATCLKTVQTCAEKRLVHVVHSTAEWTKFSVTIASALFKKEKCTDQQALALIAAQAKIRIPARIAQLFTLALSQPLVIEKEQIENTILDFL